MGIIKNVIKKLTRETSSGHYIPEIDGLRFMAISTVILFHSYTYYNVKSGLIYDSSNVIFQIWTALCQNGYIGVYLFFAISGYILGKPFAEQHIQNAPAVSIQKYFFRRLTRIEPPYFIALIVLFIVSLFVYDYKFNDLFYHFLASFFYIHNLFFAEANPINGVLWSLEVEIQFYLLAPLICLIFKLNKLLRWVVWALLILIFSIVSIKYDPELMGFKTIAGYFQYFLSGLFLADVNLSSLKMRELVQKKYWKVIGFCAFLFLLFIDVNYQPFLRPIYCFVIVIFYYLVLNNLFWRKIFSIVSFTIIGGMCYSIYLLHYKIISFVGSMTIGVNLYESYFISFILQLIIYTFAILLASVIFYLIVERPTMKRSWYRKLLIMLGLKNL
jgi:peptidoglycan/LPS O-acetylase OafA/YrhL